MTADSLIENANANANAAPEIPSTTTANSGENILMNSDTISTAAIGDPFTARLEDGRRLLATRKLNEAVESLGKLAQDMSAELDGDSLNPKLAPVWFLYGQALFQLATAQAPLLGSSVAEEIPVGIEESALKSVDSGRFVFEGEPVAADDDERNDGEKEGDDDNDDDEYEDVDEKEEEDREGNDGEEAVNDFEAAWEALETARLIYSKLPESRMELAEVYLTLGDLSLEEERFDQAANDYKDGLVIKQGLLSKHNRELAEIHYKLALALEYKGENEGALGEMEQAMGILRWRLNLLKEHMSSTQTNTIPSPKGKGKAVASLEKPMTAEEIEGERNDLEMLLPDIQSKIEELRSSSQRSAEESNDVDSPSAKRAVEDASNTSSAPATAVNDLSFLVKKKVKPVAVANNSESMAAAGSLATAEKRKLYSDGSSEIEKEKKLKVLDKDDS